MKIHTIKIRRIREIEELDIECRDHSMIAIVGENGSGKTTVFFSLIFALTGELILKGNKKEHVRDIGDGPAWVEVTFEVNGRIVTVRRGMSATTCTLKVEGVEKPIKGSTKVNNWLREQGLEPTRILQAFLPQGEADALFRATDAERATLCLRTFGLSDIESYDDALRDAMDPFLKRIDNTLDDRLEESQAQLKIAKGNLEEADKRLEFATEARGVLADAEAVIRNEEARKAADSKRAELVALRDRDVADKRQLTAEKASEQERCDLLTQQVADTTEAYEKAKAAIYAAQQYQRDAVRRTELQQQERAAEEALYEAEHKLSEAKRQLEAAGDPQELQESLQGLQRQLEVTRGVQTYLDRQKGSQARLSKAQSDQKALEAALAEKHPQEELLSDRKFFSDKLALWRHQQQNAKDGRCGTCGQVWDDVPSPEKLAEQIQAAEDSMRTVDKLIDERSSLEEEIRSALKAAQLAQEAIDADEEEIRRLVESAGIVELQDLDGLIVSRDQLEAKRKEAVAATEAVTKHRHEVDLAWQNSKSARDQLATLAWREVSADELAEAEQLTAAYEDQKQQMQATALRRDMLEKRIKDIDERLAGYDQELGRLEELAAGEGMDAEIVDQAKGIIADSDAIHAEYDAAMSEQAGVKREFEMFDRQVTELSARLEQQRADRKKLDVLQGARFILHREQLPRFVCSYYTEIVSQQWAEELERFGAKFTAWQDPESLEFHARFQNGNERRVYQLSGGERQLAIVAYLRVRSRLFAPDLGILGFDEPTTHVDERFRPVIAEVFRNMAAQADKEGLQVFVVDHAPEFLAAIPAAIRLQKSA